MWVFTHCDTPISRMQDGYVFNTLHLMHHIDNSRVAMMVQIPGHDVSRHWVHRNVGWLLLPSVHLPESMAVWPARMGKARGLLHCACHGAEGPPTGNWHLS